MRATFKVTGDDLVERRMLGLRERLRDPRQAMLRAGQVVAEANVARIEAGKGGRKLKPATVQRKRRRGQPEKRLIATGRLLASLQPPRGARARLAAGFGRGDGRFDARGSVLRYGTRLPYATYQRGLGGRIISISKVTRVRATKAIRDETLRDL
jgi:hypothetical protein